MVTRVRIGWAIAAVVASGGTAAAAERWPAEQNRCGEEVNTLAIVDCLEGRRALWDGRLNLAWKALNASLAGETRRLAALKAAEQAWIKFRDANCAYQYSQDGTIKHVATANCLLDMTHDRAVELQAELPQ